VEIEVYKLNEQVSLAFFTALVVEKQKSVIKAQKEVLNEKLKTIQSGIKNGMVEKSAALVIQAEILNLEQREIELRAGKNTAVQMLSILTGKPDFANAEFVFETPDNLFNASVNRPELQLFSSQTYQLETQMLLLDKTRNPKLFGFGQAGYGKPGLNMLNDSFDTYYLVGVGVSWNAFDWKNKDHKKQVLRFQQEIIQEQEATFSQNIQLLLASQKEQITKLENMLTTDEQIVLLRNEIAKSSASKLENETITVADYIQDVQAETISKLNYELHKIQLNEALEKYNLIKGK
jgi:outer membrane protein TolC